MLTTNYIRENYDEAVARLQKRGIKNIADTLMSILKYDDERKSLQAEIDIAKQELNESSKKVGDFFKAGNLEEAEKIKASVPSLKEFIKEKEDQSTVVVDQLEALLLTVPNVPHDSVPAGSNETDNEIFLDWNEKLPSLNSDALPHWELAKKYDIIDFELGVKITGSGFPVYKGKGARLQRALINFFLDEATNAGYLEIQPPHLVNESSAKATGQLPDKEGQMYHAVADDLYLIPTAEVPITNIYRDVILSESDFPIKLTGYTPCFRREAGSYGKDVRGLNRVHQFDKIEIVQIAHPDHSYEILKDMVTHVENVLNKLELPFRILRLCGGDLGFTSALTFDFETYSAAQGRWLEVSSVSNFETFQANRLKLRFKSEDKKTRLAHTLNGSALALARIVATLLENNQTPDGIVLPKALVPYTGFDIIK